MLDCRQTTMMLDGADKKHGCEIQPGRNLASKFATIQFAMKSFASPPPPVEWASQ